MAACARRSTHLAAVDALTEHNHFSCRAFRNGKTVHCCRTSVWMRPLGGLRGDFNGIARRRRYAWTWGDVCDAAFRAASIDNPVDPSANIIGNVERTIRSHGQTSGTMFGSSGRFHRSGETIRKYFADQFNLNRGGSAEALARNDIKLVLVKAPGFVRGLEGSALVERLRSFGGWVLYRVRSNAF